MTNEYIRLLNEGESVRNNAYARQTKDENPSLRMEDRLRAAEIIDRMIDLHGDWIIYLAKAAE